MNPFETVANEIDREFLNNTGSQEFAFEFVKGSKTCTATVPKTRNYFRRKLEEMAEEKVNGVELRHDGEDCQVWTFPVKYLRLQKPRKGREFTEEEKQALRERLAAARAKGQTVKLSEEEEELLDEMDDGGENC
ncbi:MAG: hypothetical protein IKO10_16950 [Lachnospiraceae bacterium]|nr:hypothetical protein [Lachnospiraceae bacterium]